MSHYHLELIVPPMPTDGPGLDLFVSAALAPYSVENKEETPFYDYFNYGCDFANLRGKPDICRISKLPLGLTAYAVGVCNRADDGDPWLPFMLTRCASNGVTTQKTSWSGLVADALKEYQEYTENFQSFAAVTDDWLSVTIKYHR